MENGTTEGNKEGMLEGKTGVTKLEQDLLKTHRQRKLLECQCAHLNLDSMFCLRWKL